MTTMKTPDGTSYEIAGPENAPCIVLIHGLGLNRQCWQWTTPALIGDYRVLTYDLFGHGYSAAPPQMPSLQLFSRQLTDLLDYCGIESAAITGFSLGGMIARRTAQDAPDRVAALAILHSPHQRTDAAQAAILKRVQQARKEGPASTVDAAVGRWFTDDFRHANPAMMDLVRTWVMANDIAIYHTIYKVLASGIAEITASSPPLTCPTLVMTGDEDYGNGPEMAAAIAAEIEGAEVHILPGLRHMALAENPDAVNQPLQAFFDRVFKGRAL
ncbi:alpha/beta fold hydrolase [Roseovarius arcticus]|uniref:alpha/beta fold hydrolase n=1 Tax=Roseovarius arcticus TaxID=2547404 RepID=UPI001FEB99F3|nr:alpha/beta hydrolase [Roseovarius arcticus]